MNITRKHVHCSTQILGISYNWTEHRGFEETTKSSSEECSQFIAE